ncbi:MAG: ATP-dependent Clp protease ATP-binding subunit, partial [Candidatus Cloacimonetes bacterium]|nr:ATP-dependent Clp protease ATP-binding subunit [Candidatus Cloacimonadota bacterium]
VFREFWWFFVFLPTLWLYYQNYVRQPKKRVERVERGKIEQAMTAAAGKLWRDFKRKHFKPDLTIGDISFFAKDLFLTSKVKDIFLRLDFSQEKQEEFLQKLGQLKTVSIKKDLDGLAENILQTAKKFQHNYVDEDIILLSLVATIPQFEQALKQEGISIDAIDDTISWVEEKAQARESWKFWQDRHFHLRGGPDLAFVAGFIPTLKHFSIDISKLVKQGKIPRIVGREPEIEEILQTLSRTTQGNVLLIGPPGVGKTSIIYAITQRLLADKKIIQLDLAGIVAGTAGRGDLEWRVQKTLQEAGKGKLILFIDEIEGLVSAGLADYFSPTLATGDVQIIGATTRQDYKNLLEPQPLFATYFKTIEISEPTIKDAIKILQGVAEEIEKDQEVTITYPAIEASVNLSHQYIHGRVLPDKAVDLLDETAVFVREKSKEKKEKVVVTDEDVAYILSQQIGIPLTQITLTESEKLLNLEEILHQRIVGQDNAISAISNALRRARAGLAPGNRPLASFLFLGPTGVGKTETT